MSVPNVPSTIIAWVWVLAVIFAFVSNKLWVFDSKSFERAVLMKEAISFVSCQLLTEILDVVIVYVAVDSMQWNGMLWKIISNELVIILNYVASKLVIFKMKN